MEFKKSSMENMGIKIVLVTGSEGYIGAVLVPKLLKNGYKVIGVDTCYYGKFNSGKNFSLIRKDFKYLTINDLNKVEAVIHLAALSNDPLGELNPELTRQVNNKLTVKFAEKCKRAKIKKFIFSSSCSIYGINKKGIVNEKSPVNPLTEYAKSKIKAEKELIKLADKKFWVIILRNSTVYGYSPSFRSDLVLNNFVSWALAKKQIRVMSDGTPWRPLIDVRDLSDIFILFLKTTEEKVNKNIINIGFNDNNFQVKDILNRVKKYLPKCKIIYTGEHGKDSRSYKVNFDKFHKLFPDYNQKWNIDRSIKDMIMILKRIKQFKKYFLKGNYSRLEILKKMNYGKK